MQNAHHRQHHNHRPNPSHGKSNHQRDTETLPRGKEDERRADQRHCAANRGMLIIRAGIQSLKQTRGRKANDDNGQGKDNGLEKKEHRMPARQKHGCPDEERDAAKAGPPNEKKERLSGKIALHNRAEKRTHRRAAERFKNSQKGEQAPHIVQVHVRYYTNVLCGCALKRVYQYANPIVTMYGYLYSVLSFPAVSIHFRRLLMFYLPRQDEEGQGLVEYALILVLVAIVVIAILAIVGPQIGNIFSRVTNGLAGT